MPDSPAFVSHQQTWYRFATRMAEKAPPNLPMRRLKLTAALAVVLALVLALSLIHI